MNERFKFEGIDHVQLAAPAGCEEKARKFYGELLGFHELEKPLALQKRGGVWFHCGKHQVHIGVQPDFVPATKAHPGFQVVGLEKLRSHLLNHQHIVIDDSDRTDEGVSRIFVNDPFGNRLEFLEYK